MFNFKEEPPSTKALKQYFIDGNYQSHPGDMLDCVAHMIIAIENPKETVRVALGYMGNHLSACRADAGFAAPTDTVYTPLSEYCNQATRPPSVEKLVLSNQHDVLQRVWRSRTPVKYENVSSNPMLEDVQEILSSIKSKSMLMQRLVWDKDPIGISCVDHTLKEHDWNDEEVNFMQQFCTQFFAPLAGISNYWHNPTMHQMFKKPSESELIAIRLAAEGLSYKKIAEELNKSVRTIENQLRNARLRLNATNQAELIKKCEPWL
ncbi:MAG: LuxR C-terminal-related transcriptional regulator [Gammaproteobacteria bacterium]|nr:LuxR C-terminal-related transcriptional regulator [Gammaproteobacteria bacterium]